jgi:hypothetical protein
MAQLRWQKPADGSGTLAMAHIRWQRTSASGSGCQRTAIRVTLIEKFLIFQVLMPDISN